MNKGAPRQREHESNGGTIRQVGEFVLNIFHHALEPASTNSSSHFLMWSLMIIEGDLFKVDLPKLKYNIKVVDD